MFGAWLIRLFGLEEDRNFHDQEQEFQDNILAQEQHFQGSFKAKEQQVQNQLLDLSARTDRR
jgi:hypothetical protein